ncbi:GNAT family N-acetyltransferase [Vibrio parahaemolyticus]|nr:GNAT family N-acetyltransferase [Vibrio parahaemolyticus]
MKVQRINAEQTLQLRQQVLWPTQSIEFCKVADDETGYHYGGYVDGDLVGVASVFFNEGSARLRKFAVFPSLQGRGLGSLMLETMIADAKTLNAEIFWCDARESALGIYQKFGLQKEGERFYKSDIPYFKMSLDLSV